MTKYPSRLDNFVRKNYKGKTNKELTDLVNKEFDCDMTVSKMKSYKGNRNLNSGLTGRFEKGNVPRNKGKKGIRYPGCERTWFKKGSIPKNHKQVGSTRVDIDGYTYIKVAEPDKWKLLHRIIWEEKYGPIPENNIVIFLNGNKSDIRLDNLRLISKAENVIRNKFKLMSNDKDLSELGITTAKLFIKTKKR